MDIVYDVVISNKVIKTNGCNDIVVCNIVIHFTTSTTKPFLLNEGLQGRFKQGKKKNTPSELGEWDN